MALITSAKDLGVNLGCCEIENHSASRCSFWSTQNPLSRPVKFTELQHCSQGCNTNSFKTSIRGDNNRSHKKYGNLIQLGKLVASKIKSTNSNESVFWRVQPKEINIVFVKWYGNKTCNINWYNYMHTVSVKTVTVNCETKMEYRLYDEGWEAIAQIRE